MGWPVAVVPWQFRQVPGSTPTWSYRLTTEKELVLLWHCEQSAVVIG